MTEKFPPGISLTILFKGQEKNWRAEINKTLETIDIGAILGLATTKELIKQALINNRVEETRATSLLENLTNTFLILGIAIGKEHAKDITLKYYESTEETSEKKDNSYFG